MSEPILKTQQWLTQSVIKHQFCPYAKQPHDHQHIAYTLFTGSDLVSLLETLAHCCITLDTQPSNTLETTLLIINGDDNFLAHFDDYLDALEVANELLRKPSVFARRFSEAFYTKHAASIPSSWEHDYQLASFHPQYQFEGSDANDRENYTNRSPYPIFHILRNTSLDNVRMNDDRAERIVANNLATLSQLSDTAFNALQSLSTSAHVETDDKKQT